MSHYVVTKKHSFKCSNQRSIMNFTRKISIEIPKYVLEKGFVVTILHEQYLLSMKKQWEVKFSRWIFTYAKNKLL